MYPFATVQYLIDDDFLVPSADTLPFGWVPKHTQPASDLIDAFRKMEEIWQQVPYECFRSTGTEGRPDMFGPGRDDDIADAVLVANMQS